MALSMSNPATWFISAGVFISSAYTSIMQENADERLNVAFNLVKEQKNYAVYQTWVAWHTVANRYDVEE